MRPLAALRRLATVLALCLLAAAVAGAPAGVAKPRRTRRTTCKAGQLAVPKRLPRKTFTLGVAAKGPAVCVTPAATKDRVSKTAAVLHKRAAKRVKRLRSRKVRRLTQVVNRVVAAQPPTARDIHVTDSGSAPGGAGQATDFGGTQDGVVVHGTAVTTPVDANGVGDGTTSTTTVGSKKADGAKVTVDTKRSTRSRSDGCPSVSGLVEGTIEEDAEKTTTTTIGSRRVTEVESRTVTTTFDAQVGDDANVASVSLERHEHGETSTRTQVEDVATKDRATYDIDVTVPAGGQPTAKGSTAVHAGKRSQQVDAAIDDDVVDAARQAGQDQVGGLIERARQVWQTPNRCAQALPKGDGQTVKRGGSATVMVDMVTAPRASGGGATGGGGDVVPGRFTATGACGATPDPGTAVSSSTAPARFNVVDSGRAWGTRSQPKGCLQLRGTSRAGVTSTSLTFPVITTYVVTYTGSSSYSFSSTLSFMGVTSLREQQDTYGWNTTYAPLTLAAGQTVEGDTAGTDVLSGSATQHNRDSGPPVDERHCQSVGVPSDREGNLPRLTITAATATGFDMELRESGVARWDATCDDGDEPPIYPASSDDGSPDLDFQRAVHVDYAQLQDGPLSIAVGSTPEQAHHDCSAENVSCTSSETWSGTITLDNGQ